MLTFWAYLYSIFIPWRDCNDFQNISEQKQWFDLLAERMLGTFVPALIFKNSDRTSMNEKLSICHHFMLEKVNIFHRLLLYCFKHG